MATTTFTDTLRAKVSEIAPDDTDWRLFIWDHRNYILNSASLHVVDIDMISQYQYRPLEYLQFVVNTDPRLTWIMLFINGLASDMEFTRDLTELYIPNPDTIYDLRSTYLSIVAAAKKAN